MKTQKLKLNQIKVESFITRLNDGQSNTINGALANPNNGVVNPKNATLTSDLKTQLTCPTGGICTASAGTSCDGPVTGGCGTICQATQEFWTWVLTL